MCFLSSVITHRDWHGLRTEATFHICRVSKETSQWRSSQRFHRCVYRQTGSSTFTEETSASANTHPGHKNAQHTLSSIIEGRHNLTTLLTNIYFKGNCSPPDPKVTVHQPPTIYEQRAPSAGGLWWSRVIYQWSLVLLLILQGLSAATVMQCHYTCFPTEIHA